MDKKEILKIIGQNIRLNRNAQRLSRSKLAKKSGISCSTIAALENFYSNNVSIEVLVKIASSLNMSFEALIHSISEDEDVQKKYEIKRTYYPPIMLEQEISSFLELIVIIPLIDLCDFYESLCQINGVVEDREEYISQLIGYCWSRVEDSPSKQYAQKVIRAIFEKRNGWMNDNKAEIDELYYEGWQAYYEKSRKILEYLKLVNKLSAENGIFR